MLGHFRAVEQTVTVDSMAVAQLVTLVTPEPLVLPVTLAQVVMEQPLVALGHPATLALMEIPVTLAQVAMEQPPVAPDHPVTLALMVMRAQQVTQAQARQRATPVALGVQVQRVMPVPRVMQALVQMPVALDLRATLALMVMRVQPVLRAQVLRRAAQALRAMQVWPVMPELRAARALALHPATLDRLTLAAQETPGQRLQPTAQTPQKFGRFSKLRSRLEPVVHRVKSPLLGDGSRTTKNCDGVL